MIRRKPRRGFTLIEMVLVMGLGAIGLAMITAAIHTMFKLRAAEDRRDEVAKQVHEAAVRFREDAHNSPGIVDKVDALKSSESLLIFSKKGKGFVAWQSDEKGVRRGEFFATKAPVWETKLDLLREPKAVFKAEKDWQEWIFLKSQERCLNTNHAKPLKEPLDSEPWARQPEASHDFPDHANRASRTPPNHPKRICACWGGRTVRRPGDAGLHPCPDRGELPSPGSDLGTPGTIGPIGLFRRRSGQIQTPFQGRDRQGCY